MKQWNSIMCWGYFAQHLVQVSAEGNQVSKVSTLLLSWPNDLYLILYKNNPGCPSSCKNTVSKLSVLKILSTGKGRNETHFHGFTNSIVTVVYCCSWIHLYVFNSVGWFSFMTRTVNFLNNFNLYIVES